MKLNKERQKLYLDGKVCIHYQNDDVELLREVCKMDYNGDSVYYWYTKSGRKVCDKYKSPNLPIHPISWFYEENEFPKRVIVDKATQGTEWYKDYIGTAFNVVRELNSDDYIVEHLGSKSNYLIAKSDCTPITETNNEFPKMVKYLDKVWDVINKVKNLYSLSLPDKSVSCFAHITECTPINESTPTSYKLNIDIPEWLLKAGDEIEAGRLPRSIIEHIATPCTTFTLENGTQIELTANDIDKIKKL